MEDEEDKKWCYNCYWRRGQGGSCHDLCPVRCDFGYGIEDCEYWKLETDNSYKAVNQFSTWSGRDNPWPDWEEFVKEIKATNGDE